MIASRQVKIPFYKSIGRQRGSRFGTLAQVVEGTAIPFLRKYIVPAAKRGCAELLEFAVPEIVDVVCDRRNFKMAAESVRIQTLRKKLGSSSRKKSRITPTQFAIQTSPSGRDIFANIFTKIYPTTSFDENSLIFKRIVTNTLI